MSQLKKVCFKLSLTNDKRSRRVIAERIKHPEITEAERSLKRGYKEMATINLSLAQMCFDADSETLRQCEEKLTECE